MGPPDDCPYGSPRLEGNPPKLIDLMSKLPKGSSVSETEAAIVAGTHGNDGKIKKKKGPSAKNLMAKKGRQRKLNDRLYMSRSVIPKVARWTRHW